MNSNIGHEAIRRPAKNGDEQDAFALNHRIHGFRAGERASIKSRASRVTRRNVRAELRSGKEF